MPELCECPAKKSGHLSEGLELRPVLPCVDVEVGEDQGVEGAILCRPLHHGLEPGRKLEVKVYSQPQYTDLVAAAVTLIPGNVLTVLR